MKSHYNDENQLLAINHGSGPALVSAGPGSGKTYVITNRIHNLISYFRISPSKILVITFTKAAAGEMRARYLDLSQTISTEVVFGTFHSIYLNFLKIFNSKSIGNIIELNKQRELISNIINSSTFLSGNVYFNNINPDDLISAISYYKSTGYSCPSEYPKELFEEFFHQYEECMIASGRMDYDDILLRCYDMLKNNSEYCEKLKNHFDYILVDEFQDINQIQYKILKLIVNDSANIFVVGDDDQSIYGFRGANPKVMSEFINDYPNAKHISLDINYRSKKNIIEAADKVISHNLVRLNKCNHYSIDDIQHGFFKTLIYSSKEEQYWDIKKIYLEQLEEGKSVAILVRTNKDIFSIKEYFSDSILISENQSISTELKYKIYHDLKAYISFALYKDRASFFNIINVPNRNLSRNIILDEKVDLAQLVIKFQGTYKGNSLSVLKRHFDVLSKSSPFAFTMYLFNIIEYKKYFFEKYIAQKKQTQAIFDEIIDISRKSKNLTEMYEKLNKDVSAPKNIKNDKYNIMTFHSSKGLEFDTVILPDVNEGKIPGRASLKADDTEEERRLFYVAMTRAKSRLIITCVKGEGSIRVLPSRFITEFLK